MNARPPAAEISHFALFGEQAGDDDPEFIHIEEIRTRSSLYDWQITPHRHRRMFQFLYMVAGSAEVRLDQSSHPSPARAPSVFRAASCMPSASSPAPKAGW